MTITRIPPELVGKTISSIFDGIEKQGGNTFWVARLEFTDGTSALLETYTDSWDENYSRIVMEDRK